MHQAETPKNPDSVENEVSINSGTQNHNNELDAELSMINEIQQITAVTENKVICSLCQSQGWGNERNE